MRNPSPDRETAELLRLADQCVKCGYCLPHCPTFQLAHDEGESPRGRIALIQGWLSGELPLGPRLEAHLDQCLECRACEPACPSMVQYGSLMDGARAQRVQQRPLWRQSLGRFRLDLLARPAWLRLTVLAGSVYRWLRLPKPLVQRAAARWSLFAVLDPLARSLRWPNAARRIATFEDRSNCAQYPLPSGHRPAKEAHPVGLHDARTDRPTLFRGCIARAAQQPTERALLRVLDCVGRPPDVPTGQVCCGAIHRHNGYPQAAERQLERNRALFGDRPLVGFASACVAELQAHGGLDAIEICRYLMDLEWPRHLKLAPLPVKVAVHEPCSHRNLLRDQQAVYRLLQRIPEISVTALPGNEHCCGAAGTYLTEHPATALALARPKIDALKDLRPAFLLTTNTGCALHLAARAQEAGLETEVLHPVELIERQLFLEP